MQDSEKCAVLLSKYPVWGISLVKWSFFHFPIMPVETRIWGTFNIIIYIYTILEGGWFVEHTQAVYKQRALRAECLQGFAKEGVRNDCGKFLLVE